MKKLAIIVFAVLCIITPAQALEFEAGVLMPIFIGNENEMDFRATAPGAIIAFGSEDLKVEVFYEQTDLYMVQQRAGTLQLLSVGIRKDAKTQYFVFNFGAGMTFPSLEEAHSWGEATNYQLKKVNLGTIRGDIKKGISWFRDVEMEIDPTWYVKVGVKDNIWDWLEIGVSFIYRQFPWEFYADIDGEGSYWDGGGTQDGSALWFEVKIPF